MNLYDYIFYMIFVYILIYSLTTQKYKFLYTRRINYNTKYIK